MADRLVEASSPIDADSGCNAPLRPTTVVIRTWGLAVRCAGGPADAGPIYSLLRLRRCRGD